MVVWLMEREHEMAIKEKFMLVHEFESPVWGRGCETEREVLVENISEGFAYTLRTLIRNDPDANLRYFGDLRVESMTEGNEDEQA